MADPFTLDPEDDEKSAQDISALSGIPLRQALIAQKMRRAQMLMGMAPPAQGAQVGRTYVASSPLEHLANAMLKVQGMRGMRDAEADMPNLIAQQQQGAMAQHAQARADKRLGQSIQLGGLKTQQERLGLDQRAADRADMEAMARESDKAAAQKRWEAEQAFKERELGLRRQDLETGRTEKTRAAGMKAAEDLRKEFQGLATYKNTQTVAESAKKILSASETGPGDLSLLYGYMKLLDPGSTVREGEFAQAAATGSLPERVQGYAMRVINGEKLPKEVRDQFRKEARSVLRAQADRYEDTAKPYRRLAEQAGVKPEDVVLDMGLASLLQEPSASTAAPAAAAPVRKSIGDKTYEKRADGWYEVP